MIWVIAAHFLWMGSSSALYATYATIRQSRYSRSSPDLLQAMRDESDASAILNRMLLIACVFSPFAIIVNEMNWFLRKCSQTQENSHL
jgi:hypothetical protein